MGSRDERMGEFKTLMLNEIGKCVPANLWSIPGVRDACFTRVMEDIHMFIPSETARIRAYHAKARSGELELLQTFDYYRCVIRETMAERDRYEYRHAHIKASNLKRVTELNKKYNDIGGDEKYEALGGDIRLTELKKVVCTVPWSVSAIDDHLMKLFGQRNENCCGDDCECDCDDMIVWPACGKILLTYGDLFIPHAKACAGGRRYVCPRS